MKPPREAAPRPSANRQATLDRYGFPVPVYRPRPVVRRRFMQTKLLQYFAQRKNIAKS